MSKLSALATAKRAARQNPAFKQAIVYATATDAGAPVYTAEGELQYDKADDTLGYIDKTKETVLTLAATYQGSHLVTVLSEVAPNGAALILIDSTFYQIVSVHSSNVLATMVTYDCRALDATDAPTIRNA
ncbi:hypothetical protein [Thalassovita sp.]|uniref:hypothetical protein n=1 Tax=Thalassovita sp. TaxID=1979401 RepID=UPI002B273A5B|nr:hypothetical protein [Thalassovita sp.]